MIFLTAFLGMMVILGGFVDYYKIGCQLGDSEGPCRTGLRASAREAESGNSNRNFEVELESAESVRLGSRKDVRNRRGQSTHNVVTAAANTPGATYANGEGRRESHSKSPTALVRSFILCFSPQRNIKALLEPHPTTGTAAPFACFNAIRFFAMWGVIMGHTFLWQVISLPFGGGPSSLYSVLPPGGLLSSFSTLLFGLEMGVDSFFFISGFLAMFIVLRKLDKGKLGTHFSLGDSPQKGQSALLWIPAMFLHRWLRIVPLLIFLIWVFMWLSPYMGSGPLWGEMSNGSLGQTSCQDLWWTNLIFINNFYPWNASNNEVCRHATQEKLGSRKPNSHKSFLTIRIHRCAMVSHVSGPWQGSE